MFAIRSTVHTTTQHTPSQLVLGRDKANWHFIKKRKRALINKCNQKEYCRRQSHVYRTGDKGLLKNAWKTKFIQDTYAGPSTVTEVRYNGTARTRRGNIQTPITCATSPLSKNRIDFNYRAACHI